MILKVNLECHNTDYISYNISFVVYFDLSYNQSLIQFLDLSYLNSSVIGILPYTLLRFRTLVSCSEKNTFWELEPLPCLSFCVHYEMMGTTKTPPSLILKRMMTSLCLTLFYVQENIYTEHV